MPTALAYAALPPLHPSHLSHLAYAALHPSLSPPTPPIPPVTKPAVQFYLSMKFNPSPHVLKMRGLYDSRRELVRGSENAHLVWVSDGDFDEGAAKRVRERFGL